MSRPLLAVDAPFLLYRSFFALPESITGIDGRPVGALLGATNAILRVTAERDPRAIVFCFGAEAAEYRVELYPPYHADRPPVPEALAWQIDAAPELFEAFGWSSQSADGFEADDLLHSLAAVESEAFDLVLMDIQMPEMDGFEATAAIRQSERSTGRHQPIVAMTAHAMKGDDQRCVDAGMDGYLAKPIRGEELYALLEGFQESHMPAKPIVGPAILPAAVL